MYKKNWACKSRTLSVYTLLFNNEFGRATRLSVVIGGFARVNVAVFRAHFRQDQGAAAIFLVLDLNHGRLHHRLVPTQPHHLRVRISCKKGARFKKQENVSLN